MYFLLRSKYFDISLLRGVGFSVKEENELGCRALVFMILCFGIAWKYHFIHPLKKSVEAKMKREIMHLCKLKERHGWSREKIRKHVYAIYQIEPETI